MTTFVDQTYKDNAGNLHFLSAQDHENASKPDWVGPTLPDPSWIPITDEEAAAIRNTPLDLADVKSQRISYLVGEYNEITANTIQLQLESGYMGVFSSSSADLNNMKTAISQNSTTKSWSANTWLDYNNQPVIPFTFNDLVALVSAIESRKAVTTQLYQAIANINSATTADAVNAISF